MIECSANNGKPFNINQLNTGPSKNHQVLFLREHWKCGWKFGMPNQFMQIILVSTLLLSLFRSLKYDSVFIRLRTSKLWMRRAQVMCMLWLICEMMRKRKRIFTGDAKLARQVSTIESYFQHLMILRNIQLSWQFKLGTRTFLHLMIQLELRKLILSNLFKIANWQRNLKNSINKILQRKFIFMLTWTMKHGNKWKILNSRMQTSFGCRLNSRRVLAKSYAKWRYFPKI